MPDEARGAAAALAAVVLRLLHPSTVQDVALAHAWYSVCASSWDSMLDAAGERILRYSRWPAALRRLLHALYPALFVYKAITKLSGPDGPSAIHERRRWLALVYVACGVVGVLGVRSGTSARASAVRQAS